MESRSCRVAMVTVLGLDYRDSCCGLLVCGRSPMLGVCKLYAAPVHSSQNEVKKKKKGLPAWLFTFEIQLWFSSQASMFGDLH